MPIKYFPAEDIEQKAKEICDSAGMRRDFSRIHFVRSKGSKSRRTLARCHTTPRIIQTALGIKAQYVVEVISEKFDRLDDMEKTKTIIHEMLHIPKSMGGGFRHHDFVCHKSIEQVYKSYENSRK